MSIAEKESLQGIADIHLPDDAEVTRRVGDFWAENPVVFVWLRHYG